MLCVGCGRRRRPRHRERGLRGLDGGSRWGSSAFWPARPLNTAMVCQAFWGNLEIIRQHYNQRLLDTQRVGSRERF